AGLAGSAALKTIDNLVESWIARVVDQRLSEPGTQSGEKMPDTFHVPFIEMHHRRAQLNPRRMARGMLVLHNTRRVNPGQRLHRRSQQLCAAQCKILIQLSDRITAWQWKALLRNDVPGIEDLIHVMDRDSSITVVSMIRPEQGQGAAMA